MHVIPSTEFDNILIHISAIILGNQWRGEPNEVKAYWKSLAEKLKRKHFANNPNYSYRPRKPAERKRRMTPYKARILAEISDTSYDALSVDEVPDMDLSADTTEVSTTEAGNVVFDLGAMGLEEDALRASINKVHANSLPNSNIAAARSTVNNAPPILFDEFTNTSQNLQNYYSAMVDWDMVDNEVGRMYTDFTMRMQLGELTFGQQLQSSPHARHQDWKDRNRARVQREHNRARVDLLLG